MQPAQYYETTLVDRSDEVPAYTFLSAPEYAFSGAPIDESDRLRWFASELEIEVGPRLFGQGVTQYHEAIVSGVMFTLQQRPSSVSRVDIRDAPSRVSEESAEWARYLVDQAKIPFESSPLAGQSLSQFLLGTGGALTTILGALASRHPVLVAVTPAGYVLGGVTAALGDVAYHATRYHLLRLLRVPPEESRPRESDD